MFLKCFEFFCFKYILYDFRLFLRVNIKNKFLIFLIYSKIKVKEGALLSVDSMLLFALQVI